MPLSEHEQRVLAEIERRLYEEDPKFVATYGTANRPRAPHTRLRWAVAGFVLGLLCLFGLTFHLAFGLVGFGLMLASVVVGTVALRALSAERVRTIGTQLRGAIDRRRQPED